MTKAEHERSLLEQARKFSDALLLRMIDRYSGEATDMSNTSEHRQRCIELCSVYEQVLDERVNARASVDDSEAEEL